MTQFLKNNAWGIITAILIAGMNYGIVVTRLEAVERRLAEHDLALQQLASVRTMDYRLTVIQEEIKEVKTKMSNYDDSIQRFYREDWVKVETLVKQVEMLHRDILRETRSNNVARRSGP